LIEIFLLQALTLEAQGHTLAAFNKLAQSLLMAESEGYTRLYLNERAPLKSLLTKFAKSRSTNRPAQAEKLMLQYTHKLLNAFEHNFLSTRLYPESVGSYQAVNNFTSAEPLSERELEVLYQATLGLSNLQIAEQLIIAPGTVRRHLNNIYSKFGVQSRTQAIALARKRGLL
jgi:LuxR family transcriptional regulator, maltose regulon positive regulatory protein